MAKHADLKRGWIKTKKPSSRKRLPLAGPQVQIFSLCFVSHPLRRHSVWKVNVGAIRRAATLFCPFICPTLTRSKPRAPLSRCPAAVFGSLPSHRRFSAGRSFTTRRLLVHLSKSRSPLHGRGGGRGKKPCRLLNEKFALATMDAQTVVGCQWPVKTSVQHHRRAQQPSLKRRC